MSATDLVSKPLHGSNRYVHTRAQLHRSGSSKPINGWVEALDQTHIRIRLKSHSLHIEAGESVQVSLTGTDKCAKFSANVFRLVGSIIELERTSDIEYSDQTQEAHVSLVGQSCMLSLDGTQCLATTIDISETALAINVPIELTPGEPLEFRIMPPTGSVRGIGEVLYCKRCPDGGANFRAAIVVKSLGVVDKARWKLLLDRALTA